MASYCMNGYGHYNYMHPVRGVGESVCVKGYKYVVQRSLFELYPGTYCIVGALNELTTLDPFSQIASRVAEHVEAGGSDQYVFLQNLGDGSLLLRTHADHVRLTVASDGAALVCRSVPVRSTESSSYVHLIYLAPPSSSAHDNPTSSIHDDVGVTALQARILELNPDVEFVVFDKKFDVELLTPAFLREDDAGAEDDGDEFGGTRVESGDEDAATLEPHRRAWARLMCMAQPTCKTTKTTVLIEHGTPPVPALLLPVGLLEPVFPENDNEEKRPLCRVPLDVLETVWLQLLAGTNVASLVVEDEESMGVDVVEILSSVGARAQMLVAHELALRTIFSTIANWF